MASSKKTTGEEGRATTPRQDPWATICQEKLQRLSASIAALEISLAEYEARWDQFRAEIEVEYPATPTKSERRAAAIAARRCASEIRAHFKGRATRQWIEKVVEDGLTLVEAQMAFER